MKISLMVIAFISIVALTNCNKPDCEEIPKENCGCPELLDRVCGCNNVTYDNSCEAECKGITNYKKGKCK
jgi:hypothetical protein